MATKKYPTDEWKIIRFQRSENKKKKYDVILSNIETGERIKMSFGAIRDNGIPYDQFKDNTPLGLYTKFDHGDKKRLKNYYARHGRIDSRYWSPDLLSKLFLW